MQEHPSVSVTEAPAPLGASAARRVLVWCPEAFVGPHLQLMVVIARILADLGHQPLFPYCDNLFKRCVPKDAFSLPPGAPQEQHDQVCAYCLNNLQALLGGSGLAVFKLGDVVTEEIRERAERIVAALTDEELLDFTYDEARIGSLCRHDLSLALKLLLDAALAPEHYLYLREYLPTVLATYIGLIETLPGKGFTDIVLYGQYAPNMAAFFAARKLGMGTRLVANIDHIGIDRRRLFVFQGQTHHMLGEIVAAWPQARDLTLPEELVAEIGDDVMARFGSVGHTTYSLAKTSGTDLYEALRLDRARKLVVIFTSSLDEAQARDVLARATGYVGPTDARPFDTQIDWLSFLAEALAGRDDLQVVIRVHPREDSNKRDKVASHHLTLLRQHLTGLPDSMRVVWPRDPVSSYDLLEIADQVQTWGSTIGLEAARIGVPVLKLNNGDVNQPEGDFIQVAGTPEDYLRLMDEVLGWAPDLDRLIQAWRFYGFSRFTSSIDLRDVISDPSMRALPPYARPAHAERLAAALFQPDWTWTVNRAAEGADYRPSPEIEKAAIKRQLRRILHFLMTGADETAVEGSFGVKDDRCVYVCRGQVFERRTEACRRLAALAS